MGRGFYNSNEATAYQTDKNSSAGSCGSSSSGSSVKLGAMKADKKDRKIRLDLISPFAIVALGAALTYGEIKYWSRNWELGMEWSRLYGAVLRHIFQWWLRRGKDKEQGLGHLGAALFGIHCLIHYEVTGTGLDDRPDYGKIPEEWVDMIYHGNIPKKIKPILKSKNY